MAHTYLALIEEDGADETDRPTTSPAGDNPLFIDPYIADGFATRGDEHPLLAYAASGMIPLRSAIPVPSGGRWR
jgi:hypothetical protein